MSATTKIEWAEATWNCLLGCSKTSPGCKFCYAIRVVHRLASNPNPKVRAANQGLTVIQNGAPNWTGVVRLLPDRLSIPSKRKQPTTYFVNSLSDMFHESLPFHDIDQIVGVMAWAREHRYLCLTKRSEGLREYSLGLASLGPRERSQRMAASKGFSVPLENCGDLPWPLPNVWFGVSVENCAAKERIEHLRQTPAAIRFLSIEPLLEDIGELDLSGIHWVIAGGESQKGARPMHPTWALNVRDQCVAARVPFFFKQWGSYGAVTADDRHGNIPAYKARLLSPDGQFCAGTPADYSWPMTKVGKKAAGRMLDGREWNEYPEAAHD